MRLVLFKAFYTDYGIKLSNGEIYRAAANNELLKGI